VGGARVKFGATEMPVGLVVEVWLDLCKPDKQKQKQNFTRILRLDAELKSFPAHAKIFPYYLFGK
jgi:hypothetical protein